MGVWDTTTPAGSANLRDGDDRIREMKTAIQEALQVDGKFPGAAPSTAPIYRPRGGKDTTANRPAVGEGGLYYDTTLGTLLRSDGTNYDNLVGIPTGATAARPTNPLNGTLYFNTDTNGLERYTGSAWAYVSFPTTRPTGTSVIVGGVGLSSSSGLFTSVSTSYADVTNLSVTLVTTGRPVIVQLIPDGSANRSYLGAEWNSSGSTAARYGAFIKALRDATDIGFHELSITGTEAASSWLSYVPIGSITFFDVPSAASHVYKVQLAARTTTALATVSYAKLIAYEL